MKCRASVQASVPSQKTDFLSDNNEAHVYLPYGLRQAKIPKAPTHVGWSEFMGVNSISNAVSPAALKFNRTSTS